VDSFFNSVAQLQLEARARALTNRARRGVFKKGNITARRRRQASLGSCRDRIYSIPRKVSTMW
jgi:hypothetical protein